MLPPSIDCCLRAMRGLAGSCGEPFGGGALAKACTTPDGFLPVGINAASLKDVCTGDVAAAVPGCPGTSSLDTTRVTPGICSVRRTAASRCCWLVTVPLSQAKPSLYLTPM